MQQTTYTQKELMERWNVSKQTIIGLEADGRLYRLKKLQGQGNPGTGRNG